jgi:hypothetical protein
VFNDGPTHRRASFKSVKIVHRDWKKAIIVRGNRMRPGRSPHEGEIVMASLKGSWNNQNPRHTFSEAGRFIRLSPGCTREAAADGQREFATLAHAQGDLGDGHLDFLVAGYDTSPPLGSTAAELATAIAAMTDDHTAMFAGVACTADDEGIADWFETVAKAGRSHAGDMRRALDNMR